MEVLTAVTPSLWLEASHPDLPPDSLHPVVIEHLLGPITVRRRHPNEPLTEAFRLIYDVYVRELKLLSPAQLPPEQAAQHPKCDVWDDAPTTVHVLALQNGTVVGHMRILRDGPLGLPIERTEFALAKLASELLAQLSRSDSYYYTTMMLVTGKKLDRS